MREVWLRRVVLEFKGNLDHTVHSRWFIDTKYQDVKIDFEVNLTADYPWPQGTISIYGLSPESRSFFATTAKAVVLRTGWQDEDVKPESVPSLFEGKVEFAAVRQEGVDKVLEMSLGGLEALNASFGKSYEGEQAMTIVIGDIMREASGITHSLPEWMKSYKVEKDWKHEGTVREALTRICEMVNAYWFVNYPLKTVVFGKRASDFISGGVVGLEREEDPSPETSVRVTADTGLLGVPEPTDKGADFRILLNTRSTMANRYFVESPFWNSGNQQILRAAALRHVGDTRGSIYYTEVEGEYARLLTGEDRILVGG